MNLLFQLLETQTLIGILAAVAVAGTVITLGMPYLQGNQLSQRMRYVASEREEIRKRERARLHAADGKQKTRLKGESNAYMQSVVDKLNLKTALSTDDTVNKLRMAGFRGSAPLTAFLFFRVALPIVLFAVTLVYALSLPNINQPFGIKLIAALGMGYLGFFAPNLYISNRIQKRQDSIRRAWPDALDLLLICVESGMSIEAAFRRVAQEVGVQSVPLAEEVALLTAELSYLDDRRKAFENLGMRTGLDGVKAVTTSLIQAERYGTPLGQALRVMAQENRDMRMAAAERKAAALPPKLTVPMILFFLPVLFVVILGPAVMQIMDVMG